MSKLVPLTLAAAVAALGACTTPPQASGPAQSEAKIATNVHPYYAGSGVVQQVFPAPASAAAGGSAQPLQRLEIKMDGGATQYVDTSSPGFTKGTRVILTQDKQIRRM